MTVSSSSTAAVPQDTASLDRLSIDTIRTLSIDAVTKANSGHPGLPLGAAPMAYVLWTRFRKHAPTNPDWFDRDRFVLSAGHGSMLLYSLLYLTGYDLTLDDLKSFRQWKSKTPGHPEHHLTPGVDATTGPLGQGFANGVGMAIAEAYLAAHFNRPGFEIVNHHTYAICSDGDLMEGISAEAASLAGHLKLGKLIYLYDDNSISLDGPTSLSFDQEDVTLRFEAHGWQVLYVEDGNDIEAIDGAIREAQAYTEKPSLIRIKTHIGFGSPKQDTSKVHGSALTPDEVIATKRNLGWPSEEPFWVPEEALAHFREAVDRGKLWEKEWHELFERYKRAHPDLAAQWDVAMTGKLPAGWDADIPAFGPGDAQATRQASGKVLNAIAPKLPTLIGGSADLSTSTETELKGYGIFAPGKYAGRNIYFGVREHAMGAAVNGMSLHQGVWPFGGTFLMFFSYMMNPVRMAAIMETPSIFVYTHDSIGLGEDGPTHQQVEVLAAMRAIPFLYTLRPADANETAEAWRIAIERRDGPSALCFSRQKLPILDHSEGQPAGDARKGGYVLARETGKDAPDVILMGSGSEVQWLVGARTILQGQGIATRVVSMPCQELFLQQPQAYRDEVLPPAVRARLACEAAASEPWFRFVGLDGTTVCLDHFGASAPADIIFKEFGFTAENVAAKARALVKK
ncbi:MAG TPA: transketolase [Chloroflexota bacterium]|nr:transketolase [Chloroflexota bacterium]